ncbi:hypothetical protein EOI86_03540 [Hwanghaeella grinnelliae]|uniref:Uncharacterized protein n=1 Tax=Hwanghaeella grinnelliae TaxID=2500179 RepID=A0A3S3UQS3_9PROT|nr:hypothetical protein [Hwanghaeella grinnelliae]RVU38374.1 hypothetical protein EOI86_03540 [Hwanghaeella grinnelliae]
MRTDYAYQDAIRRDFRNKVSAVIAVGLLALVLTGAIEDKSFMVSDVDTTGAAAVNVGVSGGDSRAR